MAEVTVSASAARARFAELLDRVDTCRVLVTRRGRAPAMLVSAREFRALEETLAVLADQILVQALKASLSDLSAGAVRDARAAFAELDSEFGERA